jgi:hypothetical protein
MKKPKTATRAQSSSNVTQTSDPAYIGLRDYLASAAMQALLSCHVEFWPDTLYEESNGSISQAAHIMADCMLTERAQ